MKIKYKSFFKDVNQDHAWFENWVHQLEVLNGRQYQRLPVNTSLGKTHVWALNTHLESAESLVIFPGARTTALFWDFDKGLDNLAPPVKFFLVETNGLPNLSDGDTPEIKSSDFGAWAAEVLNQLKIEQCFVAGASFGGLICMKLAIQDPEKIKAIFLLNPGCLQTFSLSFKNLYYNLLPIFSPKKKNVLKFLESAIFCKPNHQLSAAAEKMIVDYEIFALTRYKDNTQKPYFMQQELRNIRSITFLLEGNKDLLFPFNKSVDNARSLIGNLQDVKIFDQVGHGIETYPEAMAYIGKNIQNHQKFE